MKMNMNIKTENEYKRQVEAIVSLIFIKKGGTKQNFQLVTGLLSSKVLKQKDFLRRKYSDLSVRKIFIF